MRQLVPTTKISDPEKEIKATTGDKIKEESTSSTFAITVGYNFNEDIFSSWWIKGALGAGSDKTETDDPTDTPQNSKSDISTSFFYVEGGKRFSLNSWGLKNFSYSPSLALTSSSYGKDADGLGLKSGTHLQLNIVKLDILF